MFTSEHSFNHFSIGFFFYLYNDFWVDYFLIYFQLLSHWLLCSHYLFGLLLWFRSTNDLLVLFNSSKNVDRNTVIVWSFHWVVDNFLGINAILMAAHDSESIFDDDDLSLCVQKERKKKIYIPRNRRSSLSQNHEQIATHTHTHTFHIVCLCFCLSAIFNVPALINK